MAYVPASTISVTMIKKYGSVPIAFIVALGIVGVTGLTIYASEQPTPTCKPAHDAFCYEPQISAQAQVLGNVAIPKLATPSWLPQGQPAAREVTYTIQTKGTITADIAEFKAQVSETLTSPLGWSRLGVRFTPVESGGQYTIWLAEASQVPSFSQSGCDTEVSCTVGNNVIINQTRWLNGSDSWNNGGGSLRDYRHMVLNHETGHWLGHGHEFCPGPGQPAPVMQQQTINMQGCKPNPWPLASEMYAPKLGIRS